MRTVHGSHPTGALRASKFVPDEFVDPTSLRDSGFSPSRISQ